MRIARRTLLAGLATLPALPAFASTTTPRITRIGRGLDQVVDPAARFERIATGLRWAEGPAWSRTGGYLLFSDVPANVVHCWAPGEEPEPFLDPSGLRGPVPDTIREAGANGLAFDAEGMLILADSGSRALVRVDPATKARTVLADRFEGKRFNSPNDVAITRGGAIWFTDPPYGLVDGNDSPVKELGWNGIYRRDPDGRMTLLERTVSYPNGIALSPDERTLYIGVSDEAAPQLLAFAVGADGRLGPRRVMQDFARDKAAGGAGLPDGMKVDAGGRIYATGPGGVHVLSPTGERLGLIATGAAIANVGFGEDGQTLFLTASDSVWRLRLRASGWA